LKDLRRRRLYKSHAINGRYELSAKEDRELSLFETWNREHNGNWQLMDNTAHRNTISPENLTDNVGHWAEYPKNQKYGSRGYDLKSHSNKKLRQALKDSIDKELNYGT